MKIACRTGAWGLGLATVVYLGVLPLSAQEPAAPAAKPPGAEAPATKRPADPSRRVPSYFGEIGLTPEQKESIYKIRGKRRQQIVDLEKQISQLKAETMAECETVLTEPQKQMLEHRRRVATESKKSQDAAKTPKEAVK